MTAYDSDYYENNSQDEDRIALRWYSRVLRKMLPRGSVVLDFGSGFGFLSLHLSDWAQPISLDQSATARAQTARRVPSARVIAGLDELDKDSLDAVVALHVLEHVQEPQNLLQEITHLLRPGGILFFVVPDTEGRGHRIKGKEWFAYKDPTHCTFLPSRRWRELTEQAGFEVLIEGSDGLWDSPYSRRIPFSIDRLIFGFPLIVNVLRSRICEHANRGECTIIVAQRPSSK